MLDDNLDIVDVVTEVLNYEQFEAKSIVTCVGFFDTDESYRPELIIFDYRLVDGHGGDICQKIKTHPNLKQTPVIIFSAYTHADLDFKQYGCDPFHLQAV